MPNVAGKSREIWRRGVHHVPRDLTDASPRVGEGFSPNKNGNKPLIVLLPGSPERPPDRMRTDRPQISLIPILRNIFSLW